MDVMAPLAVLHIICHPKPVQKTFNPQHKAGAQFTDPEGIEGWVILESATSGSWTRAVGVDVDLAPKLFYISSIHYWYTNRRTEAGAWNDFIDRFRFNESLLFVWICRQWHHNDFVTIEALVDVNQTLQLYVSRRCNHRRNQTYQVPLL